MANPKLIQTEEHVYSQGHLKLKMQYPFIIQLSKQMITTLQCIISMTTFQQNVHVVMIIMHIMTYDFSSCQSEIVSRIVASYQ